MVILNTQIATTTNFEVSVRDLSTGITVYTDIDVAPDPEGDFSVLIPNVVMPNGDAINDTWDVMDGDNGKGPLNAFRYELNIVNRNGSSVFSRSVTITTGISFAPMLFDKEYGSLPFCKSMMRKCRSVSSAPIGY
ncbi:MAG: gliding motility-associated C-terminal domain-containing protein [Cytophagales bacterium]|nr:gliding motility-associated C-terminal domain-containing protein [Cytophagales bacterium]